MRPEAARWAAGEATTTHWSGSHPRRRTPNRVIEPAQKAEALRRKCDRETVALSALREGFLATFEQRADVLSRFDCWWGGEFYSLISDCAVAPTWHPPDPDDFRELAGQLRGLNEYVLFKTVEDAHSFKSYYKTKPWAEAEDYEGAFGVVRIEAV